jgi:transposase
MQKGEPAMKKNNTCLKSPKRNKTRKRLLTIGMDLGDKTSRYCVLDSDGEIVREGTVTTTKKGMKQRFWKSGRVPDSDRRRDTFAVGKPAAEQPGHEVIVADARQVKLISASSRKDDRLDAQTLARAGAHGFPTAAHPASRREGARRPAASAGAGGAGRLHAPGW